MKSCTYCGHENEDSAGTCASCGTLFAVVSDGEPSVEHVKVATERESTLARKLLTIRDARRPWLAVLRVQYRPMIFKSVLVAGLTAAACWIGFKWAPAFAIGCAAAFVLIEAFLLRECRKNCALLEQWTDWELVQQTAGTSPQEPESEMTSSGSETT